MGRQVCLTSGLDLVLILLNIVYCHNNNINIIAVSGVAFNNNTFIHSSGLQLCLPQTTPRLLDTNRVNKVDLSSRISKMQ